MHDTVVVDTDDALLVCNRENAQQVKQVVEYLHAHQFEAYV
jgi:mannose-1-phosphate guanylyltransferase